MKSFPPQKKIVFKWEFLLYVKTKCRQYNKILMFWCFTKYGFSIPSIACLFQVVTSIFLSLQSLIVLCFGRLPGKYEVFICGTIAKLCSEFLEAFMLCLIYLAHSLREDLKKNSFNLGFIQNKSDHPSPAPRIFKVWGTF